MDTTPKPQKQVSDASSVRPHLYIVFFSKNQFYLARIN
jgi:hypothetical protein